MNDRKFFAVVGALACLMIAIAVSFTVEFSTSFAQNLVKTTGAVYLCLIIVYSFILLYRFANKRNLILSLKEILLTIVFLFAVYNFALLVDKVLVFTHRDLDAVPSNIITYCIITAFMVFQKIILWKHSTEDDLKIESPR